MIKQEIQFEADAIKYDDKVFCYLQRIYVDGVCWYIGRHTSLDECNEKFLLYINNFKK